MVYNPETKKMVPLSVAKAESQEAGVKYISIPATVADQLLRFAKEDGWDFSGVSYVTLKDKDGKTRKDATGNPVYKKDKDGKVETVAIPESKAKMTGAIRSYVEIAIKDFITARNTPKTT